MPYIDKILKFQNQWWITCSPIYIRILVLVPLVKGLLVGRIHRYGDEAIDLGDLF